MKAILDTCAMIAYLKDEPGGDLVETLLMDSTTDCYADSVNLCEVYYLFSKRSGESTAREAIRDLFSLDLVELPDMDRPFWEAVVSHKVRGKIALADCSCLALARRLFGQVVTSDRLEFDPLVPLGLCPIVFIR